MFSDLIDDSHSDLNVIVIGSHLCFGKKLYFVTRGGPNNGIKTERALINFLLLRYEKTKIL